MAIGDEPGAARDAARVGLTATYRPGQKEEVLLDLERLGVRRLRAVFSWASWAGHEAEAAGLLERLAARVDVVPCVVADVPGTGSALADFVEELLQRCALDVGWVELRMGGSATEAVAEAAQRVRGTGRRVIVSVSGVDLDAATAAAPLEEADAVGVDLDGVPGDEWRGVVARARAALLGCPAWVVRAGCSSWPHEGLAQARAFLRAVELPAERCYWDGVRDATPIDESTDVDPRRRTGGVLHADGREKLLGRLLIDHGLPGVREAVAWAERDERMEVRGGERAVLITGGAGFIGCNLAARLLAAGRRVVLYDDLSRRGVEENARWLLDTFGDRARLVIADVRDRLRVREAVEDVGEVFHLAAQVAVTTSLVHPLVDFEVNALGTHVLLEELRLARQRGHGARSIVFTSTNKVYGSLADVPLVERSTRWDPADPQLRARGISEARSLDLHSPYGCSKGAADQYMIEYARTFGLPAVVFRMSCIYGPRQLGTPDQGWVSQFALCALENAPLTIYGDGKQVRDVLHVEDLVDAFLLASERAPELAGRSFNIGGGPQNTVSLLELLELLRALGGRPAPIAYAAARLGDQRYYVSDTTLFRQETGWSPRINVRTGVTRLMRWLAESPAYTRRARSA